MSKLNEPIEVPEPTDTLERSVKAMRAVARAVSAIPPADASFTLTAFADLCDDGRCAATLAIAKALAGLDEESRKRVIEHVRAARE